MPGPPVRTASVVTGDRRVKNKKFRLRNGPGIYGTTKTYGTQTHGFKGGVGGGFGYTGSMMMGRSR